MPRLVPIPMANRTNAAPILFPWSNISPIFIIPGSGPEYSGTANPVMSSGESLSAWCMVCWSAPNGITADSRAVPVSPIA